ncbi:MAG: helix-turn-helix domain-containing protein [Planctomycetes bacterium]|nr:helix-turn-helix domain-containing protein [Planctomycetota bacterium]
MLHVLPLDDALAVGIVEAARLLRLHPETLRREVARGNLRACRVGRVLRIRTAELHAYLKRLEVRNPREAV